MSSLKQKLKNRSYRVVERHKEHVARTEPRRKRDRAWQDPFPLPSPLPMPANAEQLMLAIDKMPYAQRNAYVARLGRDQASHPGLPTLIKELRQVQPPYLAPPLALALATPLSELHHSLLQFTLSNIIFLFGVCSARSGFFLLSPSLFSFIFLLFPLPPSSQHPEPDVPQIEVEEGFTQLLPPQQRNTAKFYAHDLVRIPFSFRVPLSNVGLPESSDLDSDQAP